jgi:tRNA-dihydrouridine synthase B
MPGKLALTGLSQGLSELLNRPLTIGNKTVERRIFLAPMSKLTTVSLRRVVAGFGGYGLLFSEMCSARALPQVRPNTAYGFRWSPGELPRLVCQIFGDNPQIMANAAKRIEQQGFFAVEINFGCAAAIVCKQGCGAALLKTPERAAAIVAAVAKAVTIPVMVKFRTGWSDDVSLAKDLARRFAGAGADALTFHPRVAQDRRTRPPRWEYIGEIKSSVDIPVIGNGNVFCRADCLKMMESTGCDAVSIGRLAIARPWIFAQWTQGLQPDTERFRDTALDLARCLTADYGETVAMRRFNKFAAYFATNFRFGHTLFSRICKANRMAEVQKVIEQFLDTGPEIVLRPNLSLFR